MHTSFFAQISDYANLRHVSMKTMSSALGIPLTNAFGETLQVNCLRKMFISPVSWISKSQNNNYISTATNTRRGELCSTSTSSRTCWPVRDIGVSQRTHYAIMTSLLRQNDVVLMLLRQNDVALTLWRRYYYVMCSGGFYALVTQRLFRISCWIRAYASLWYI